MTFVNDLADLMPDTATWYPLSARDRFGQTTYGTGTEYSTRLVRRNRLVRDTQGDQVVSSAQLWLAGAPAIAPDDRVTLSDGKSPDILSVERFQDESGASFTKAYFR